MNRYLFGTARIMSPSRFLNEIPKKYLQTPSYASETSDILQDYYEGMRVNHQIFGEGIIQKVYESSMGTTCDILFEDNDEIRSLVTKYAKLSIC